MPSTLLRAYLVAMGLLLHACAPSPSELSLQAVAKMSHWIADRISPSLYARLESLGVSTAGNRTIALVFPPGGKPPPNATCAADVKAALERELRQLSARTRIDFQMVRDVEKAAVVFVVGDTAEMLDAGIPPLKSWINAAERRAPAQTMVARDNRSTPHSISDFFEGVFTEGDGRLIFGASFIHWFEMTGRANQKDCAPNFVERLTRIYLRMDFPDEYGAISRQARAQFRVSPYEVDSLDMAHFNEGILFCAQFVDRTQLAEYAVEIVKLLSERKP